MAKDRKDHPIKFSPTILDGKPIMEYDEDGEYIHIDDYNWMKSLYECQIKDPLGE